MNFSLMSATNLRTIWEKFKDFEAFTRQEDGDIILFMTEWEEKMAKAQTAGCQYSDILLALKLMEKVNLGDDFVLALLSKLGTERRGSLLLQVIGKIKNEGSFLRSKPPETGQRNEGGNRTWIEEERRSYADVERSKESSWSEQGPTLEEQLSPKEVDEDDMSSYVDFEDFEESVEKSDKAEVKTYESLDDSDKEIDKFDESDQKPLGNYCCNLCSQTFRSKFKWEQHLKLHSNRYQCSKCAKGFLTKNVLIVHMRRCQPGVTLDLNDIDLEDKALVKNEDGEPADDKDSVKDEKTISPCEICGRLLKESSMKNHLGTHNRKFKCNICNKRFSTKAVLKTHTESHTTRRDFICTFCGKGYKTKLVLNIHMNTHTKAKSYICAWCGKKFFNSVSWKVRVRSQHTGEDAHQCNVCQKKFFTATKLRYHMRTHTGEKPYKCEYCGKNFGDRTTYKRHIRRIHSKLNDLPHVKSMEEVSYEYD